MVGTSVSALPTVRLGTTQPGCVSDDVTTLRLALGREFGHPEHPDSWNTFGPATQRQYALWQRSLGIPMDDADGVPTRDTLAALGARYGFTVATE
jgi:hypothetical protein